MNLMYDGINSLAAGIARAHPDAAKVAGYLNGTYAWDQAQWNLFPHADHVTISVRAQWTVGDVLDVENGDATPAEAAAWIDARHAAGLYRPTVYCSLSVVPDGRRETGHLILGRDYDIWVARYDRSPVAPPVPGLPPARFAAKQYESDALWDVSAVYDTAWPHRTPDHPAPVPAPAGPSGTATAANVAWHVVTGPDGKPVASYRLQKRDGAGNVTQSMVSGVHASVALAGPGPHSWRVQAPNGAWTGWLPIG
jgi:hypothetical protein